jgi:glucokinase
VRLSVGVDIGGTKILAVVIDSAGVIHATGRVATPKSRGHVLDAIDEAIGCALAVLSEGTTLHGLGIGWPGLVDRAGRLYLTSNLHEIDDLTTDDVIVPRLERSFGAAFSAKRGLKVVSDNDGTCAAVGEHLYGAGRGTGNSVTVTLGTGIGGGAVVGGAVLRGERNFAGEVGHMVVDRSGPLCGCGRRGCWERLASGSAVALFARTLALQGQATRLVELAGCVDSVRAEHVNVALKEGDSAAVSVAEQFGTYLAAGLANLALIFDPAKIIVGGGLGVAAPQLISFGLSAYETELPGAPGFAPVRVVPAQLGERAGAIGAAALALGLVR